MKCTGTDLHVVGLHEDAALLGPVVLQAEYQFLECQRRIWKVLGSSATETVDKL